MKDWKTVGRLNSKSNFRVFSTDLKHSCWSHQVRGREADKWMRALFSGLVKWIKECSGENHRVLKLVRRSCTVATVHVSSYTFNGKVPVSPKDSKTWSLPDHLERQKQSSSTKDHFYLAGNKICLS